MSEKQRSRRAKLNIVFSLIGQVITLICGLIVPRALITAFGSEAYGACGSIAQFLSYITLLEGGIGGVARAALYKPLAINDKSSISSVLREIQRFFWIIGGFFVIYVLLLAVSFQSISKVECFDWLSTFLLVIVISVSTFAQYFIGITYQILLNAAQRVYITQLFSSVVTVLNTLCVVTLVFHQSSLIVVKLISSAVFLIKPIGQYLYVRKAMKISIAGQRNPKALEQKWTGLGQHLAYFVHTNTDIAVLTVLTNLSYVAVYSIYDMIVSQVKNFATSFSTGMEALFGDMLAKKESKSLKKAFETYESIISFVSGMLFSVTAVMILPFIQIYTSGIHDVNYIYPIFGMLMIVAAYVYCLRMPYHAMIIAAGHFKQTRIAAYGEALINISLSIVCVIKYNLVGVAIGTVIAVLFRTIYYVWYLSNNIFYRKVGQFIKRLMCNIGAVLLTYYMGNIVIGYMKINDYLSWGICSILVVIVAIVIQAIVLFVFYHSVAKELVEKLCRKQHE